MNIITDLCCKFFGGHIGTPFLIVVFLTIWVGQVFIQIFKESFEGALANTDFTIIAATFSMLIIGLIYWIIAHTTNRVQRL